MHFSLLINNKEYNGKSLSDFGITKDGVTTYRLLNDIELTDEDCKRMKPIGMDGKTLEYKDIFDGQGFSICNLNSSQYQFGKKRTLRSYIRKCYDLKNLCIKGAKPNAQRKSDAGILVGYNKGYIINCSIQKSTVKSNARSGGIAAFSTGTIVNCSVVSCHLESQSAGGAAGEASGKIINSFLVNDTIKNKYYRSQCRWNIW